jgi:hypothetical protein
MNKKQAYKYNNQPLKQWNNLLVYIMVELKVKFGV